MVTLMALNLPGMTGTTDAYVLDANNTRNQFIRLGDAFTVVLDWTLNGAAVSLGNPTNVWHVRARLDSIGAPDVELQLVPEYMTNFVATPGHAYRAQITPTVPVAGLVEGVYELTVLLDLRRADGTRLPAQGFQSAPDVNFYS